MNLFERYPVAKSIWKELKPWLIAILLLLILRYSGMLGYVTTCAQRAVLMTGILDADPERNNTTKTSFDYDFTIQTLEGENVDFSHFKGKTVFLNLWATWCGPCRAEMPGIQKLYNKVGNDSIAFVMVSIDRPEDLDKIKKYVSSNQYTFPVYYVAGDLPKQLETKLIPSTFILSPDGSIEFSKAGMADYSGNKFVKFLEKLSQ